MEVQKKGMGVEEEFVLVATPRAIPIKTGLKARSRR